MSSSLSDDIEKDVLPWLQLAEDLRILKLDVELNMPQICVMGDQSSGKSSVLESLSGIPFPRGTGLVTRCPIRMVMKKGKAWSAVVSTSLDPQEKIPAKDVAELSSTMERLTHELCSNAASDGNSSFSTESIVIELSSPDACDLTVVDLPGIIRTVTSGQSTASIQQVNKMIKSYLQDQRTIILAVIPANQDIATVDILERAQGVDPSGERTIGVLTKVDLIGEGAEDELLAVVNNVRKPLELGYVMLKNRSQREIIEKVSTGKARELEASFFANHPVFKRVSSKLYGVGQLSKKLTCLLVRRIKQEMAPMKQLVDKQLADVRASLRLLPASYSAAETPADRQKLLVTIVQEYVRHLIDSIRGEYRDRVMVRNADLRMYTIVLGKFEEFQLKIENSVPLFKDEAFVEDLASQIDQLRGRELPGFMSSQAFYMCMSRYVDEWARPTLDLLQTVKATAGDVACKLSEVLLGQYSGLMQALKMATESILDTITEESTKRVDDLLAREKDPFTLNDFLAQWVNKIKFDRFSSAVDTCFEDAKNPATNWNALKEEIFMGMRHWYRSTHSVSANASAQEMSAILEAYWHLSAQRFTDNCCMLADKEILGKLPTLLQDQMYRYIKDDTKLKLFFAESPTLVTQRKEAECRRERLLKASAKLSSVAAIALPATSTSSSTVSSPVAVVANEGSSATVTTTASVSTSVSASAGSNLRFFVPLGDHGLGITLSHSIVNGNKCLYVKGFRSTMPNSMPNPCQAAGIQVGDSIIAINDTTPTDQQSAVELLRKAKGTVKLEVARS